MRFKLKSGLLLILTTIIGSIIGVVLGWSSPEPIRRDILIKARQYAFEPSVIRVNRGDTLHIKLVSLDVVHGFFVEGYDLDAEIFANQKTFNIRHPSTDEEWLEVDELVIIADRRGKFRYRCSHTCGSLHPFMQGELIVEPNTPNHAGFGGVFGLFIGMMWNFARRGKIPLPTFWQKISVLGRALKDSP
jgi:cytochrome c oxidase subunit 2